MHYNVKKTGHGKTDNLLSQFQKIVRGCNQKSIETRHRYIEGMERFIKHVGVTFSLQNVRNIQNKHLESYARDMKERDLSDKYVKNELAAIRFFHNQISDTKYKLAESREFNSKVLELGSTKDGRADRAWSHRETTAMRKIAIELDRPEIARIIDLMRLTGARLDEACTFKRDQIERAINTRTLEFRNTKGGRPRSIPVSDRLKEFLERSIVGVGRGNYVFTPDKYVKEHKIHAFEKAVEDFIYNNRNKAQDPERNNTGHNIAPGERSALTAHGLRHTYCRERVYELLEKGYTRQEAKLEVSQEAGHNRPEVLEIYLAEAYGK